MAAQAQYLQLTVMNANQPQYDSFQTSLPNQYDALVACHPDDEDRARKFIDLLKQRINEKGLYKGNDLSFRLLSDAQTNCDKFDALEKEMECSTYLMPYVTANFVRDLWSRFVSNKFLQSTLEDPNRKWCLIPVWTAGEYKKPFAISNIGGIEERKVRDQNLLADQYTIQKIATVFNEKIELKSIRADGRMLTGASLSVPLRAIEDRQPIVIRVEGLEQAGKLLNRDSGNRTSGSSEVFVPDMPVTLVDEPSSQSETQVSDVSLDGTAVSKSGAACGMGNENSTQNTGLSNTTQNGPVGVSAISPVSPPGASSPPKSHPVSKRSVPKSDPAPLSNPSINDRLRANQRSAQSNEPAAEIIPQPVAKYSTGLAAEELHSDSAASPINSSASVSAYNAETTQNHASDSNSFQPLTVHPPY